MVANTIRILVDYAKENPLMLIAVGVENREDMNNLRNMGINYMQGYVFSAQKDPKDFIADVMTTPWVENLKRKKSKSVEIEEAPAAAEAPTNAEGTPDAAAAEEPATAEEPAQTE